MERKMEIIPRTRLTWLGRKMETNLLPGQHSLGIDVGGTSVRLTVIGSDGVPIDELVSYRLPVAEGPERCLQLIAQHSRSLATTCNIPWDSIAIIGLDSPGPSSREGVLYESPNLNHPQWVNFPIRAELQKPLGKPVVYANDGDIAAWLDNLYLYPRAPEVDEQRAVYGFYIGTGFGGGTVINGQLWQGKNGAASESGHLPVIVQPNILDPKIPRCGCNRLGCVEAYVSLTALQRQLKRALELNHSGSFTGYFYTDGEGTLCKIAGELRTALDRGAAAPFLEIPDEGTKRAQQILRLAGEGNLLAQLLLDMQADSLGEYLQTAVCALDNYAISVGGGILEADSVVLERYHYRMMSSFNRSVFPAHRDCVIRFSPFKDAAAYASALWAAMRYNGMKMSA